MGVGCGGGGVCVGGLVPFILNAKMKALAKCRSALRVLVVLVRPGAGCQQPLCPPLPYPHPSPPHPRQPAVAVKRRSGARRWWGVAAATEHHRHRPLPPLPAALLPRSVANAPGEQHRVLLACPS